MSIETYCPKMPLELDENSRFEMISTILEDIKQNLKMIVLTNPGEKIMDSKFGLGIKKYLFESEKGIIEKLNNEDSYRLTDLKSNILINLRQQIISYLPDVEILDLELSLDEHIAFIKLYYSYFGYQREELVINITD